MRSKRSGFQYNSKLFVNPSKPPAWVRGVSCNYGYWLTHSAQCHHALVDARSLYFAWQEAQAVKSNLNDTESHTMSTKETDLENAIKTEQGANLLIQDLRELLKTDNLLLSELALKNLEQAVAIETNMKRIVSILKNQETEKPSAPTKNPIAYKKGKDVWDGKGKRPAWAQGLSKDELEAYRVVVYSITRVKKA